MQILPSKCGNTPLTPRGGNVHITAETGNALCQRKGGNAPFAEIPFAQISTQSEPEVNSMNSYLTEAMNHL